MLNRREFLSATACAVGVSTIAGPALRTHAATAKRPNIVVILADDMGFSDIGCYGSEIHTPNIDVLAADGLRFTQFYNTARCCPTRASLLTGLYSHQAGMGDMVGFPDQNRPSGPYQGYLNDRCVTIAEVLRQAGYSTYMSGKWHVGERPEHWPRKRGFDRYFGLISGGSSYWELSTPDPHPRIMVMDDQPCEPQGEHFYMTDAFSDYAVKCIDEHAGNENPFFLYLAYTAPHWPIHVWPDDIAKYKGVYDIGWDELRERRYRKMIELGIVDARWPLSPRDPAVPSWEDVQDREDRALRMAVYAAMIDRMDQGIGGVLSALKRSGADDNTLVLFLSDNGGCHEPVEKRKLHTDGKLPGERGSFLGYQRPWANASNTPFRMFKHWVHEGGIATPLIARWPSRVVKGGSLTHQVGHVIDMMATCCECAGVSYPQTFGGRELVPMEGRSLIDVLDGKTRASHDAIYWEHEGNKAIRQGAWKLVAAKDKNWELYNLEADRTELHDLVTENESKVESLSTLWNQWAAKCGVV